MGALIDTEAIAERLKVTRRHVTNRLTKRPDFPAPRVNTSRRHRLWDEDDVMAWAPGVKDEQQSTPTTRGNTPR